MPANRGEFDQRAASPPTGRTMGAARDRGRAGSGRSPWPQADRRIRRAVDPPTMGGEFPVAKTRAGRRGLP